MLPQKYQKNYIYGNFPNRTQVLLIANGEGIYFTASLAVYDSGSMGNSVLPSRRATFVDKVSVTSTFRTDNFALEKAKRWLEAQFERYYHGLTNACKR